MISTRSTLIMAESLLKYYSLSILVNALYVPWLWSSDRRELPRVGSARTGGRPPTGASLARNVSPVASPGSPAILNAKG